MHRMMHNPLADLIFATGIAIAFAGAIRSISRGPKRPRASRRELLADAAEAQRKQREWEAVQAAIRSADEDFDAAGFGTNPPGLPGIHPDNREQA